MKTLFPPDVRVVVDGDIGVDSDLYGYAKKAFRIAQRRQVLSGASHITTSFPVGKDAQVTATIEGPIKTVWIERVKPPSRPAPQRPVEVEGFPVGMANWLMLSGTFRNVNGATAWHPTRYTARANDISYSWRPLNRLAGHASNLYYVKSSMFTGIMPRVVQAIYGVGNVKDQSREYLTELPFNTGFAHRPMRYQTLWSTTHGVVKTGTKNHWLVEIGLRGIIAMPLPLFASTTTAEYRAYAKQKRDTGSLAVLDEFGGIPSGESFPEDDTLLTQYISEGKIIRLMTAAALDTAFYKDRSAWYGTCSWSFSDTGTIAINTARGFMSYDMKTKFNNVANLSTASMNHLYSDMGTLQFNLAPHDVSLLRLQQPVGTGSVTFTRNHRGFVTDTNRYRFFLPNTIAGRVYLPELPEGQYLTMPDNSEAFYLWVPFSDGLWEMGIEKALGEVAYTSYRRWIGPGSGELPPYRGPGPVGQVSSRYGAYLHVLYRANNQVERVRCVPLHYAAVGCSTGGITTFPNSENEGFAPSSSSESTWLATVTADSAETRVLNNAYHSGFLGFTTIGYPGWVEAQTKIPYSYWNHGAVNPNPTAGDAYATFVYGVRDAYTMTTVVRSSNNWSVFVSRQLGARTLQLPPTPGGWPVAPPVFDASISAGTPAAYVVDGHLNDGVDPVDGTSTTADLRRTLRTSGLPNGAGRLYPHQVNWTGAA